MLVRPYRRFSGALLVGNGRATGRTVHRRGRFFLLGLVSLWILASVPAVRAQQASQPSYDPRQFEQRFGDSQTGKPLAPQSRLPMPRLGQPAATSADPTPLFVLHHLSIVGARAISHDRLASAYQPY